LLTLNYRDSQPIYGQIKDGLKKLIITGALAPGDKLPSVRAMATDLAINPNTIARAYTELEAAGFIHSIPGKGSFAGRRQDGGAPELDLDAQRREALMEKLRELIAELRYLNVTNAELIAVIEEGGVQQ